MRNYHETLSRDGDPSAAAYILRTSDNGGVILSVNQTLKVVYVRTIAMILQTIMGSAASTLCRTLPNSLLKLIVVVIILIIIFFPVAALPSLAEGDFDRNAEKFVGGDAAAAGRSTLKILL